MSAENKEGVPLEALLVDYENAIYAAEGCLSYETAEYVAKRDAARAALVLRLSDSQRALDAETAMLDLVAKERDEFKRNCAEAQEFIAWWVKLGEDITGKHFVPAVDLLPMAEAAWRASTEYAERSRELLRLMLALCENASDGAWDNGVYAPSGMCEGEVFAVNLMNEVAAFLKGENEISVPLPNDPVRVEHSPGGVRLFVGGVLVHTWLGTAHAKEAEALADEVRRGLKGVHSMSVTIDINPNFHTACKHETLVFWSGGFYVACEKCGAKWVAIKGPSDTDIDYSRGSQHLSGETRGMPSQGKSE